MIFVNINENIIKERKLWKNGKNNEGVPTKLFISQLTFIINFKMWHLIKANKFPLLYYLICLLLDLNIHVC